MLSAAFEPYSGPLETVKLRHILPTIDDHADVAGFDVADDTAAGLDDAVTDIAVDRNDADVTSASLSSSTTSSTASSSAAE